MTRQSRSSGGRSSPKSIPGARRRSGVAHRAARTTSTPEPQFVATSSALRASRTVRRPVTELPVDQCASHTAANQTGDVRADPLSIRVNLVGRIQEQLVAFRTYNEGGPVFVHHHLESIVGDAPRRNRARDDEEGKGNSRPFHSPDCRNVVRTKLEPRPPAVDGEDKKETETGRQAAVTDECGLKPRPKDGNIRSIGRCRAMEGEYCREKRSVEPDDSGPTHRAADQNQCSQVSRRHRLESCGERCDETRELRAEHNPYAGQHGKEGSTRQPKERERQ